MALFLRMLGILFAALVVLSGSVAANPPPGMILVQPKRDDTMLLNPGKGWVEYGGTDNTYTKDYIGIGYNRFNWSDIEPRENEFHWQPIDDFIRQFQRYHKKVAIGVMNVSTGIHQPYVTPKWVFDAGAEPLSIADDSTPTGQQVIPKHWDDPVFLQKMHDFIRAFGGRYNGNPNLAFVDIRDYGNWGEGHTGHLGNDPSTILTPPENLKINYFLPYLQAFPHTQLIVPWGNSLYNDLYSWMVGQGAGIRRDGILSQWTKDGSECLPAFDHAPAVFEYCDSYSDTKKKGHWNTDALLRSVEAGKPSYLQWDAQIFRENTEFCRMLGNKIGYHFVLQDALVPRRISSGKATTLKLHWVNDGVAPLYEPCSVAVGLLDADGRVVQKQWATASAPKTWKPGQATPETLSLTFRDVPTGDYRLAVGLFSDRKAAAPDYRLGIQGRTAAGWYVLSEGCRVGPSVSPTPRNVPAHPGGRHRPLRHL